MKQLKFLAVIMTACLLFSCQKDVIQDEELSNNLAMAANSNQQKELPFKGTYITSSEILQPPPFLQTRITGAGNASHLGNSSFVAVSSLNFTTPPPFQLGGTATFTAANGDEIYTSFTGTATPNQDGSLNVSMVHIITGGNGRFQHASGNFSGFSVATPGHSEGSIAHEGIISY